MNLRLCFTTALLGALMVTYATARPSYTCYRLDPQSDLTIDGDLSDWPAVPILLIGKTDQLTSGSWTGPDDSHAKVAMVWGERRLYMGIEVVDDVVTQEKPPRGYRQIYKYDAIQWAVDVANDGGQAYGRGDFEYGFGKVEGRPIAYRWYSGSGWPKGIAEHIDLAVEPNPAGGVVYEAAIEYSMLPPLRPKDGRTIGFNIVLQDRDGGQHKTLQWTPGIATGKNPGAFGDVVFSKAAPSTKGGSLLISSPDQVGPSGFDVHAIAPGGMQAESLDYAIRDAEDRVVARGTLAQQAEGSDTYAGHIASAELAPGTFVVAVMDDSGNVLRQFAFERSPVEKIHRLVKQNQELAGALQELVEQAQDSTAQTFYARSAVAVHRVFERFIEEDIGDERFKLTLHNVQTIHDALTKRKQQLSAWLERDEGTPAPLRLPGLDYTRTRKVGRYLFVDNRRVLLVGPMSWVWELKDAIDTIGDLGYNQVKVGFMGQHHFDAEGRLKKTSELPWWAVRKILRDAHRNRMSFGISMLCPDQVWRGASRRGDLSLSEFHEIYDHFARREIKALTRAKGGGEVFDYTIEVEAQRAHVEYESAHHLDMWVQYLNDAYGTVDKLNSVRGSDYGDFEHVPFPESLPEDAAPRYDYTRMRQRMIADELSRACDVIRLNDPGSLVHGYPYVWTFRDPAAYYEHCLDPELDTGNMDIVGCDTSGTYSSDRYAMPTMNWLAGYYDLMQGIAEERPLCDGEYHYANRRKIYPDNWARAIYFQSYIHALSSSYSWVWLRSGSTDAALLMDAKILLQSAEAALDLRRLAEPVTAFHRQPNEVVFLYSNASSPHSRERGEVTLSQSKQTDLAYEGLFFEGLNLGYVTERQLQRGQIGEDVPLIVPNSSHVEKATLDAIETFARAGGEVVLVGDALERSPRGLEHATFPDLKTVTRFPGFTDADEARRTLVPALNSMGVRAAYRPQIDNGHDYPTVEWQRASDDAGRELLFLLNLGHSPAAVRVPPRFAGAMDLVAGERVAGSFKLGRLQFKLLRASAEAGRSDTRKETAAAVHTAPSAATEQPVAADAAPSTTSEALHPDENLVVNGAFKRNPVNKNGWVVKQGTATWANKTQVHVRQRGKTAGKLQQTVEDLQQDTDYRLRIIHAGWDGPKPRWVHSHVHLRDPQNGESIAKVMRLGTKRAQDSEPETLYLDFNSGERTRLVVSLESDTVGPEGRFRNVELAPLRVFDNLVFNGSFDRNPVNDNGWVVKQGHVGWAGVQRVHVRPRSGEAGRLQQMLAQLQPETTYTVTARHLGWEKAVPGWVQSYVRIRDPQTDEVIAEAVRRGTQHESDAGPKTLRLEFNTGDRKNVLLSLESRKTGGEARIDDVRMVRKKAQAR